MSTSDLAPQAHVLLVDDELDVLSSMGRFLRLSGFNVSMAQDMPGAVRRLNTMSDIAAVVTDLNMEAGTGNQLCAFIRSHYPSIPVLMISGMASTRDVVDAMQLGAVTFLEKPVAPEELADALTNAISAFVSDTPLRSTTNANPTSQDLSSRVRDFEKFLIEQALITHKGKVKDAMESLGLNRRTMNEKMNRLGVKRP